MDDESQRFADGTSMIIGQGAGNASHSCHDVYPLTIGPFTFLHSSSSQCYHPHSLRICQHVNYLVFHTIVAFRLSHDSALRRRLHV